MTIVQKAEKFIFELFKDKVSGVHLYHNFQHIFRVTNAAIELGKAAEISDAELEILTLAGWFHDVGYSISDQNHEEKGAEMTAEFLLQENYPAEKIKEVQRIILATQVHHHPSDSLEEIIKDADTSHFADENYIGISELLRAEWELTQNK